MHNLVEHVDIPTNMTSWAVKRIVSRFDEQQRLFSWVIGPQEQPLLETMLRGAQLWCEELAPTLSVDLHYRDDLFSEMKHPAPSSAMPPARIEDSDTLPVPERFSWDLQSDRSTPRSEVLRNADTLWSNRRQAHVQRLKGVPESTFHHFQPSNYSQAAMGPLFQTGGDRNQPEQVSEAMPDKDGAGVLDFETAVGVFEKLNVNDADPNRVERLRTLPDGTKLYLLVDRTEVEEWVRTWAYEAEPGSANVEHWTNIYSKLIELLPPNQFKMFAARNSTSGSSGQKQDHRAGEMIGVGYVHLYSGVASIHCITVLPQHRTKGLGSALTRYAMGIGKDMGLHMAMLTASTSSPSYGGKAALFSQLGFKEFGRVKMYVYRPLRLPDTAMLASDKIREAENEGWEWVDDDEDEDSD
ncbi:uncharacterized protein B0I36DRAFT_345916 [Microdochium trichocladiopsis]|uniref:N-acetyltransferase domain-containing protein n=1 Tax=Microdochium trichocladiopsis TaxID=1682393 RepID=A0A9P9BU90_9PEZI|nr:uncharacterized protein B0I36DRAFT_345916 [Microdochium trichocladiopsis]KAH7037857.1 hypothetical protein B0I36DRAFT_345916 [Microdochium trichocladiopsis]